jgi:hypothetical protein
MYFKGSLAGDRRLRVLKEMTARKVSAKRLQKIVPIFLPTANLD